MLRSLSPLHLCAESIYENELSFLLTKSTEEEILLQYSRSDSTERSKQQIALQRKWAEEEISFIFSGLWIRKERLINKSLCTFPSLPMDFL